MLLRALSLVLIIYSAYATAANSDSELQFSLQPDSLYSKYLTVEAELEKYQTLTIQDVIINSNKNTQPLDPKPLKEETFLEKLSFKTKRIFHNNSSK